MCYRGLIDNFGYNNFYKGMQISSADSQYLDLKIINGTYFNYFSIYDTFKRKEFEVTINNNCKKYLHILVIVKILKRRILVSI